MIWLTPTDAEIAAPIGTCIDVKRTGVRIIEGVIDGEGRREVAV